MAIEDAVPVEFAFARVTGTSAQRNVTTPEWVTGAVDALISVMTAWHSAVVSDFCGETKSRCEALEYLRTAQNELKMRMSETVADHEQAALMEQDQQSFVKQYEEAANQCQTALRSTSANASESLMMLQVTERLKKLLDRYRHTAASTTRKYVDRGVYTVVAILDYARWSVTEASRAAKQAREILEEARREGYQEAEQLVGSCAGRCIALRQRWEGVHRRINAVFDDLQRFNNTDNLAELATKTSIAARALNTIDKKDGRMCLASARFFTSQALALHNALQSEATNLESATKRHVDGADTMRRAALEDAIERTNANMLILSRNLAASAVKEKEFRDETQIVQHACEQLKHQKKLNELTQKRTELQKEHGRAAQQEYYSATLNKNYKQVKEVREDIKAVLVELWGVMDEADDYLRLCGERDGAYSNVDETLGHHVGRHMCRIAKHAQERFDAASTELRKAFKRDTQALATAVEQNMKQYKEQAWRELASLKQMVNNGASVGLLSAGNAISEEHKQKMKLEGLKFNTRSTALHKPLQTSEKLAEDLLRVEDTRQTQPS
jgi:hypothetical protein